MKLSRILCIDGARALQDDYLVGLVDVGGFTTRFCWTLEQALKNALDMRPDLILLADSAGDAPVAEVLERFAELESVSKTPVLLVISANELFEKYREEYPAVIGWLRRPFDPMDLADMVRHAWTRFEDSEYFS